MQTSVAPSCPSLDRFLRHGLEAVKVAVGFARAAAESAELAADKTDVGEIDIAIDHVGDDIADQARGADTSAATSRPRRSSPSAFARSRHCSRESTLPSSDARTWSSALRDSDDMRAATSDHSSAGKFSSSESGRTRVIAPPLKTSSAKQIVGRRANQITSAAPAGTIGESSNDTRRRTS